MRLFYFMIYAKKKQITVLDFEETEAPKFTAGLSE